MEGQGESRGMRRRVLPWEQKLQDSGRTRLLPPPPTHSHTHVCTHMHMHTDTHRHTWNWTRDLEHQTNTESR